MKTNNNYNSPTLVTYATKGHSRYKRRRMISIIVMGILSIFGVWFVIR